jgi:hypothetical protein
LQVERALPKLFAQPLQRNWFIEVLFDVPAYCLYHLRLTAGTGRLRTATQAGTVSGMFSILRLAEKHYILPPRTPRWARWPAVHAGRRHREHEFSIAVRITIQDRLPLWVCRGLMFNFRLHFHSEYRIGIHIP